MRTIFPSRLLWPSVLSSALLIVACAVISVLLFRQQTAVAALLKENVGSAQAADELKENLVDLQLVLQERGERVAGLHDRIDKHLETVFQFADHPRERELVREVAESYARYRKLWHERLAQTGPEHNEVIHQSQTHLETETVPKCQELADYNRLRVEGAAQEHERVLRILAWGMAAVGSTGGIAGLILGYGVARSLRQSIRHLQVQIRDAAGKIARTGPEIVVTGEGDLFHLQDQVQNLVQQVGGVVEQLQQREREVLRAEQLAAVGQLAAGVAHEIRNPLTAIKMLVQVGHTAGSQLPPEDFEVIEREIRRMEQSLQTFLDFARPPKPRRSPTDLVGLVNATFDLIRGRAAKQKVTLHFDAPNRPAVYTADPEQLRQVLVNLTLNALDVMPSGGELRVRLTAIPGQPVVLEVNDTGPGIPVELEPRLFQPFMSSKETGLGLGLVISRRIVEDHGGRLVAANRAATGACFIVTLPAEPLTR